MWDKPDEVHFIMRSTSIKYANTLIDEGAIKFNTPYSWAEYGVTGRGDIFEGTFAACHQANVQKICEYYKMYNDVETQVRNQCIYFRRKRTMNLPCYCFYLLKTSKFELPKEEGVQKISGEIDSKYFKDFMDHKSLEEIEEMKMEDRPSIVIINNPKKFIDMIVEALKKIGVKESEIMIEFVEYQNKEVEHYCTAESPKELKIKPKAFEHQQEGRIIVNTDNDEIKTILCNGVIKIGGIEDISKKSDTYFEDGIIVEMTADIEELR